MLCCNEMVNGKAFVMFTTSTNLRVLCDCDTVLMDGTFKSCPKFFQQIYGIHDVQNGYYMPLVFVLLEDKSSETYGLLLSRIKERCIEFGLCFDPRNILTDFELSAISAVSSTLPNSKLMCCRFHLGQSWWRKMQNIGLAVEYKQRGTQTSKWLTRFFGLSLLPPHEVSDAFACDIMDDAPSSAQCVQFADYIYDNYISADAAFPPALWAAAPDISVRTTNGAESFHAQLNGQFYCPRPNIYVFVDVILRIQTGTYITIHSSTQGARIDRKSSEKASQFAALYARLSSRELTRKQYLQTISYRVAPS
jgi:hypothetical protein